ncbi:unnamed protein product [Diamesa hyperborea]
MLTGCQCIHLRRVDLRMVVCNTTLAIEVDEHQHSGYKIADEEARYNDLMMVSGMYWVFIRFNPDKTRGNHQTLDERLPLLFKTIAEQLQCARSVTPNQLVKIIPIYYDKFENGVPLTPEEFLNRVSRKKCARIDTPKELVSEQIL